MIKLIWVESAVDGLVRLKEFIDINNPAAAKRAGLAIKAAIEELAEFPLLGKPVKDLLGYRDLFIKFGVSGYILRYKVSEEALYVLHIRHAREVDFAKISD
ncbi:Type II toxin-antitoxin system RelE/ParE family toxin [Candidatus Trichorickettsia mobilis]|uniref:Type II toxin-antitoxin system RelE/ParE family toxin n=1 Tax=Candidatus Trichorickettsia mobilis TaxID=1346319 RepID=A0ABZ0UWJ1_9RICK|nr:type II toxin-antitoxin system RelE/ParE family toxin [Candidatus Trichorickettsia mobilis]WPY01284.1 Type II toxin-antitoxin system RelE/ParE family toxin [Candidatus Trichorickettsia mobilis]